MTAPPADMHTCRAKLPICKINAHALLAGPKFAAWRRNPNCRSKCRREEPFPSKTGAEIACNISLFWELQSSAPPPTPPLNNLKLRSLNPLPTRKRLCSVLRSHAQTRERRPHPPPLRRLFRKNEVRNKSKGTGGNHRIQQKFVNMQEWYAGHTQA